MELWLRRLVGTFRIEGEYTNTGGSNPVRGTANCFGVGNGPGVSCVISAKWQAPKETLKDKSFDNAMYSAVQPLVLLFGMDPGASQVRVTLVDFRAIRMQGFLVDDAVIFDWEGSSDIATLYPSLFGNSLVTYNWVISRVAWRPGGDGVVQLVARDANPMARGPVEFDLQLRRERSADAGSPR
jgi:hypothetical protein